MPKKTCQLIIESGNDYVMAVKGNQQNLYRQIQHHTAHTRPTSRYIATERTRNRVTTRTVEVFEALTNLTSQWMAVALNVLRRRGYSSITCAQRFLAHDIDKILSLVE